MNVSVVNNQVADEILQLCSCLGVAASLDGHWLPRIPAKESLYHRAAAQVLQEVERVTVNERCAKSNLVLPLIALPSPAWVVRQVVTDKLPAAADGAFLIALSEEPVAEEAVAVYPPQVRPLVGIADVYAHKILLGSRCLAERQVEMVVEGGLLYRTPKEVDGAVPCSLRYQ